MFENVQYSYEGQTTFAKKTLGQTSWAHACLLLDGWRRLSLKLDVVPFSSSLLPYHPHNRVFYVFNYSESIRDHPSLAIGLCPYVDPSCHGVPCPSCIPCGWFLPVLWRVRTPVSHVAPVALRCSFVVASFVVPSRPNFRKFSNLKKNIKYKIRHKHHPNHPDDIKRY